MVKYIWKFSKKTTSLCWKMIEIFFALVFVLGALLLYQLHNEPVDAMKYIPEIEQALFPNDMGYHLRAEKVELTSDLSRDGLIQIDIENLKVLRGDDSILFSIPEAQFSYDLWHILTLNYMPSTIIVERPFLEMVVDEKGEVGLKTKESSGRVLDIKVFKKMLARILAIHDLRVTDASFQLQDNRIHQLWRLSNVNLELRRRFHFSNKARLNATLIGKGVKSRLLATANFNRYTKKLSLETGLDELNLKEIAMFVPVLKEADLTVQLSIKGEFDVAKNHKEVTDYISKIQFNAKTLKAGTLNLMGDLDNLYYVQFADINGTLGQGAKMLKIASSKVQLKNEKPTDFYLDVEGINSFLNHSDIHGLKTVLKASLYDVPMEHVPGLWPSKQGPDAHAWVRQNLSQGFLNRADFTLYFTGDELVDLLGDIRATGVRVDYLNPMKPVNDVSAQILLYPDKVRILADKGKIGDLLLEKADLLFTDLDKETSFLQIDLDVDGPVKQALELISSKPLEFPQMFDLNPSMLSGQSKTNVHLTFPLLDDLSVQDVQAIVHSDIAQLKVNKPLANFDLKNGTVALDVSNKGLKISGDIMMKNSPLKIKWHEYFEPEKIVSQYAISGTLMGEDVAELLPNFPPFIKGKFDVDFKAEKDVKGAYSGSILGDAAQAQIDLLPFAVQKKKGNPMNLSISFSDIDEKAGKLNWDVTGSLADKQDDLKLVGDVLWSKGKIHISFPQVLAGINQFSGEFNSTSQDFSVILKGKNWQAYDLNKLLNVHQDEKIETTIPVKNITLDIALDEFALSKQKPFKNLVISGKRQGALWKNFHMQAITKDPLILVYDSQKSQFQGSVSDLGDLMDRLNFTGRFSGGKVSLVADQNKKGVLRGEIGVENTELKETGFLMQAMTILGIVDAFRGKDMIFDEIKIPFSLTPDFQLNLADAYAVGTNLGVTFRGIITPDDIDLSGAVVPAYAINSLPGKIPLLGWLFRDSEAGGLINVPFTVSGALFNPVLEWNALKTVAPDALGRLF